MTRALLPLLAALASLAVATSALGSAPTASLHVQPGTAKPAGAVHVFGMAGSCAAGSQILVVSTAFPEYSFGVGAVTGHVRANHSFSFRAHLRGNATKGTYSVTAQCGGSDLGVTTNVRVR